MSPYEKYQYIAFVGVAHSQSRDQALYRDRSISRQLVYRIQSVEILIDESVNH